MIEWLNNAGRYGFVSRFFHWLMALLILCMLVFGFVLESLPAAGKPTAYGLHKSIGITLLALVMLRLLWRLFTVQPAAPAIARWQRIASKGTHWLLYLLMVAMPLSGWAMSSAFGKPVVWFGTIKLPSIIPKDPYLAPIMKEAHEIIAYGLIVLIALHVAAALYHHFIRKDGVLKRMVPGAFINGNN